MLKQKENKNYVSILQSDGTLRKVVPEGTEGAVKRDWETNDGSGTKYELVFTEISGMITKVAFHKGSFANMLQLTIEDGEEEPVILSVPSDNNFGSDLMKKLPNIDMDNYVRLVPYAFEDKASGKSKKGVTVYQGQEEDENGKMVGIKIENYFYDYDKKKNLHKFPETPIAKKGKEVNWKMYFMQVDEFLVDYISDMFGAEQVESDDADDEVDEDPDFEDTRTDAERKKHPKAPPVKKATAKKEDGEVKPSGYKGKLNGKKEPEF